MVKDVRGHGDVIWVWPEIDASKEATGSDQGGCNVITSFAQHDRSETDNEEKSFELKAGKTYKKLKPETLKSMGYVTPSDARREQ